MELGEPEKNKKNDKKAKIRRTKLDKRIERVRARHELAGLVMGAIFLV